MEVRSIKMATLFGGVIAATFAALATFAFLERAGAQAGTQAAIKIVDFGFEAPALKIKAGTTVVFKNTGERPHTATDRGGTFDTQPLDPGASGSVTFSVPGTYAIFCRINPSNSKSNKIEINSEVLTIPLAFNFGSISSMVSGTSNGNT